MNNALTFLLPLNPSETRNYCDMSSRFSRNSEGSATDLLKYLEEMFPWYYKHSDEQILNSQPYKCLLSIVKALIDYCKSKSTT